MRPKHRPPAARMRRHPKNDSFAIIITLEILTAYQLCIDILIIEVERYAVYVIIR